MAHTTQLQGSDERFLVTLDTVTVDGHVTNKATMTDAQLKEWLSSIQAIGVYASAKEKFARGMKFHEDIVLARPDVRIGRVNGDRK